MKGYDNFFLGVDNLIEAQQFYAKKLGLKVKFDFSVKGMIAYQVGAEEPAIILKDRSFFGAIKPTIWFVVDDVIDEYNRLIDQGVSFVSEPFSIGTGTAAEFMDPFGNHLGITDYNQQKWSGGK